VGYQHCKYCWFYKTTWEDFLSSTNRYAHEYRIACSVIYCGLLSVLQMHVRAIVQFSHLWKCVFLESLQGADMCKWMNIRNDEYSCCNQILAYILVYDIYVLLITFVFITAVMATGLIWSRYSTQITPVSSIFKDRLFLASSWNIEKWAKLRFICGPSVQAKFYSFTSLSSSLYVILVYIIAALSLLQEFDILN
jgi:hypothetical protein